MDLAVQNRTIDRAAEFVSELKRQGYTQVRFELPDLHGVSRSKLVPTTQVESFARKGLNFYGGILGLDTASLLVAESHLHGEINYRDGILLPDYNSLTPVPWLRNTAKVICDFHWDLDNPVECAPRYVLQRVLDLASQMGYDVMMGQEFEFYLLDGQTKQPVFDGLHAFNTIRNQYVPVLDELFEYLMASGVDLITHNCEYGPGQIEINYAPAMGMAAADRSFTFKHAVKEICYRAGYLATFMSRPFSDRLGSGCHVHISLWDKETGQNAFLDMDDKDGLSPTVKSFIQGILDHGPALMPMIAPTPNCYRRYLPPAFASSHIGWGIQDRSGMVRVKASGDDSTHIEMRAASAISNPYLSAAATIAAGLLGIRQQRQLQPSIGGQGLHDLPDVKRLPGTLEAGLEALLADAEMREILGEEFVHVFSALKRYELGRFHSHVTDWEKNEYLEIY